MCNYNIVILYSTLFYVETYFIHWNKCIKATQPVFFVKILKYLVQYLIWSFDTLKVVS